MPSYVATILSAPLVADVTKSSVVLVFIVDRFVIDPVFAFIAAAKFIVPPANGKNGPFNNVDAAIPESSITLSDTNETILFNIPVDELLTMSFVNLEFVVPAIDAFEYKV